jgi:DUF438 domain-containing protein
MDIVERIERVARALYDLHDGEAFDTADPTYDELADHIKGWYMEQAETALTASGVAELVEALENIVASHPTIESAEDQVIFDVDIARAALERYRGK